MVCRVETHGFPHKVLREFEGSELEVERKVERQGEFYDGKGTL